MLAYLKGCKSFALAYAEYGKDFGATRDGSEGPESVFSFKDASKNGYLMGGREKKGEILPFVTTVFRAIRSVHELGDGMSICVLIASPSGVSCAARAMFCKQLRNLKNIVNVDLAEFPGVVNKSWFDRTVDSIPALPKPSAFFVEIHAEDPRVARMHKEALCTPEAIGKTVQLIVKFERRDLVEANVLKKSYTIFAMQYDLNPYTTLPKMGEGYVCDRPRRSCIFCKLRQTGKLLL